MQDEPDPRRHPRTVMATDTEWQRIRERAEAAGMPISRVRVSYGIDSRGFVH